MSLRAWVRVALAGLVALVICSVWLQAQQVDPRAADRQAVQAAMKSLVAAIEAGDAKAVAALWTESGEYLRDGEGAVHGRAALEKGFAAAFADKAKRRVRVTPGPVRFLARDLAIDEGTVTIQRGADEPALTSTYSLLLAREGTAWRIAQLREGPAEESSPLHDLAWLVGDWKSAAGESADVTTHYSWDESQKFLHVRFTMKEKDRALGGFQVIGMDPATGELHAWTFEAEGGVGQSVWRRDGSHWTIESTGTLVDGRTLTALNILRRVNDDTFTWQSTQRQLDGEDLPDLPPTKVTRVKAK